MTVSRFVSLLVGLAFTCAYGSPIETTCIQADADALVEIKKWSASPFRILGRADVCIKGFELIEEPQASMTYLLAAPLELGLRTRRQVFRLNHNSGESTLIGELPASAESTGGLTFIDSFQQGGSIFQDSYVMDASGVKRNPTSFELIFEGAVCVRSNNAACRPEMSTCRDCMSLKKATRLKPLCLKHSGGISSVLPLSSCQDLVVYVD